MALGTKICDGLCRLGMYEGSMPPPAGCKVFPVLQNGFFTSRGITVNAIYPVRHLPHKVLQGLQVVRVSARVVLGVSVGGRMVSGPGASCENREGSGW